MVRVRGGMSTDTDGHVTVLDTLTVRGMSASPSFSASVKHVLSMHVVCCIYISHRPVYRFLITSCGD